ncbi:hypothetical protein COU75_02210 [Candidatus Peregrinibacteria bacterium CG10_big_fil_rev_8_21_14_0_10_42_8]|nr:MAG: hypothetical protein COU75_02210 [Candidatus Peregrinibacteria bacterium CG10_big_fil_rev_8_21_14_0_10_42_8]
MNILVIVAGTNELSNSNALADAFIQGVQQSKDVRIHKRRLKDMVIDHFSIDFYSPKCTVETDFCELQKRIEEADGFVIASPIWNFSSPAHLKNFIDRMGSFALDKTRSKGTLNGKPFYLIYTGGAPLAAWKGLMQKTSSHIPEALKYYGASYIGSHYEGKCTAGKGKFELVVDKRPKSLASLRVQGHRFAMVVAEYKKTGKASLKHRVQSKIMRIGEAILKKVS